MHNSHLPLPNQFTGDMTQYLLDTSLSEHTLYPYAFEEEIFRQIEQGTYAVDLTKDAMAYGSSANEMLSHVGTLSTNDSKQAEYLIVSAVTLSARAAIRGGVPPYTAYKMCDVYLQEIAAAATAVSMDHRKTIEDFYHIGSAAMNAFSSQVARTKNEKKQNLYIEQCKDFVSRHIHIKFQIGEISESLGISESYLSRLFSQQTGETIQQYVLSQRLEAACNMLQFSQLSMGDIAEYLCFHSQSRFSEYFRKAYGMSPTHYRKEHRVVGFEQA